MPVPCPCRARAVPVPRPRYARAVSALQASVLAVIALGPGEYITASADKTVRVWRGNCIAQTLMGAAASTSFPTLLSSLAATNAACVTVVPYRKVDITLLDVPC